MERKALWLAAASVICGLGSSLVSAVIPEAWKDAALYAGLVLIALGLVVAAFALLMPAKSREKKMSDNDDTEMGDFNTLYGKVKRPKRMGFGNTIVGATDDRGNTIVPGGTSVGFGAGHADPTTVHMGAFAGANIGKKLPDKE